MKQQRQPSDLPVFEWIAHPEIGYFIERLNRFACMIDLGEEAVKVYLPNGGRLEELLQSGAKVMVEKRRDKGKTLHDLLLIETQAYPGGEPTWAALDSRLPPKLFRFAMEYGQIDGFNGWSVSAMEPAVAGGRLDLRLTRDNRHHFIETKSVNLIDQRGTARFPDAPTERGRRHLGELVRLVREGHQASLAFIVVRHDAQAMAPFEERDPAFGQALREAAATGVNVIALAFRVGPKIHFDGCLPLNLNPDAFPGYWPPSDAVYT